MAFSSSIEPPNSYNKTKIIRIMSMHESCVVRYEGEPIKNITIHQHACTIVQSMHGSSPESNCMQKFLDNNIENIHYVLSVNECELNFISERGRILFTKFTMIIILIVVEYLFVIATCTPKKTGVYRKRTHRVTHRDRETLTHTNTDSLVHVYQPKRSQVNYITLACACSDSKNKLTPID